MQLHPQYFYVCCCHFLSGAVVSGPSIKIAFLLIYFLLSKDHQQRDGIKINNDLLNFMRKNIKYRMLRIHVIAQRMGFTQVLFLENLEFLYYFLQCGEQAKQSREFLALIHCTPAVAASPDRCTHHRVYLSTLIQAIQKYTMKPVMRTT